MVLNARDAAKRGAAIMPRTRVVGARRQDDGWLVTLSRNSQEWQVRARMLVNAGGPWVGSILEGVVGANSTDRVRLVRGSHIVTRRLFDHDRSYFLQGRDGRIIFAIPRFTLIGTTDQDHPDSTIPPVCADEEADYLLDFASQYFSTPLTRADIVWRFSGVRPLYDDGASSATAATRDYVLKVEDADGAPLLNIFGGKITTYRKLFGRPAARNTHGPLDRCAAPGGEFAPDGVERSLQRHFRSWIMPGRA